MLHIRPGRQPAVAAFKQMPGRFGFAINHYIFTNKDLMGRMGGVGLVLIDERCGGVLGIVVGIHFSTGEQHKVGRGTFDV
ncbi:hypothetical protein D3C76_1152830 [compost metagenome]